MALIADFYNIDWNIVVEVVDSERDDSVERKRRIWEKMGFHFDTVEVGI